MPFSDRAYDIATWRLLHQVLEEAWQDILSRSVYRALDPSRARRAMALLIMQAIDQGQRDPEHLKRIAISAIESPSA
jgi:hypothetical protein